MEFINLTPHDITIIANPGDNTVYPKSGTVARVETMKGTIVAPEFSFNYRIPETVSGLPEEQNGVGLIVSAMVAHALPERTDLFSPDTAEAVRDEGGNIIGVPSLVGGPGATRKWREWCDRCC